MFGLPSKQQEAAAKVAFDACIATINATPDPATMDPKLKAVCDMLNAMREIFEPSAPVGGE